MNVSATAMAAQRREDVLWSANYTEQPGIGRTTQTGTFATLRAARHFMADKRGYILRVSDGGHRLDPSRGEARFVEYAGDFEPSAQEGRLIMAVTGQEPPTRARLRRGGY